MFFVLQIMEWHRAIRFRMLLCALARCSLSLHWVASEHLLLCLEKNVHMLLVKPSVVGRKR